VAVVPLPVISSTHRIRRYVGLLDVRCSAPFCRVSDGCHTLPCRCSLRGDQRTCRSRLQLADPADVEARCTSLLPLSALETFVSGSQRRTDRNSHKPIKVCEIHPLPFCAVFPDAFVLLPSNASAFNCLLGFPKNASPSYSTAEVHSRSPVSRFPSEEALRMLLLVPPFRFFTCSTAYAFCSLRICCNPLPILRFTALHPATKQKFPRVQPTLRSFPSARSDLNHVAVY